MVVVELGSARERLHEAPCAKKSSPRILETLALAERWDRRLSAGDVNRADLAREHGVSRARVTQVLKLLQLHPVVRAFACAQPACASEYRLRTLVTVARSEQLLRAHAELPGFGEWFAATG
jgi:hypothetical protein